MWVEHLRMLSSDCEVIAQRCNNLTLEVNSMVDQSFISRHDPTINEIANIDNIHEISTDIQEKVDLLMTYACKCGEVVGEVAAFSVEKLCDEHMRREHYGIDIYDAQVR